MIADRLVCVGFRVLSVEEELRAALAEDPGFPADSQGDVAERAALVAAFERQVGFPMPAHFRSFLVDSDVFDFAPRLFSASHSTRKWALSPSTRVANAYLIAIMHETIVPYCLEYCDTDEQRSWVSRLVPVLADNDDEYFLLDFSYNPVDPPLISIRMELPWIDGMARFIASSFVEYLRYPIWNSDERPDEPVDDPTEAAREWTAWFETTVGVS